MKIFEQNGKLRFQLMDTNAGKMLFDFTIEDNIEAFIELRSHILEKIDEKLREKILNNLKTGIDGNQLMVVFNDFKNLQESPATFYERDTPLGIKIESEGLKSLSLHDLIELYGGVLSQL